MLKYLPNALTLLRLALAPIIAWAVWQAHLGVHTFWAMTAAILFVLAALTDLFDGMAARAFDANSKFGRLIDPIADKALVGLPLVALSALTSMIAPLFGYAVAACTLVIIGRDVMITLLRVTAPDGEGAPVSTLAKWKTAIELSVVGLPILASTAMDLGRPSLLACALGFAWLALLAIAAALSAFTGFRYVSAK